MANYTYVAVGPDGFEARGVLEVATQTEAVRRVREMGLFPTKIKALAKGQTGRQTVQNAMGSQPRLGFLSIYRRRVKPANLMMFTRQLATMLEAGMSLTRGLRILEEQTECRVLKGIVRKVEADIENGSSFSEALALFPRAFNALYVNLVKAGETAGALELTLGRLADYTEKAQKLKGKLKAAMFYPCAVITVATGVMTILMAYVVPSFQRVFEGLLEGAALPAFTRFVFATSNVLVHRLPAILLCVVSGVVVLTAIRKTAFGSQVCDRLKLDAPVLGNLFRKAAISRFARTLGTLVGNGVPILQALTIVKETAGNQVLGRVVARVHDAVKQGDTMAPTLKSSKIFPPMVAGMVDVGEQTGALPEMLMKVADTYDEEFDNAAKGLTSLLEPILIVALAIVVGSIVVAMFLPLITIVTNPGFGAGE